MRALVLSLFFVLAVSPRSTYADSVSDEVTLGGTAATQTTPSTRFVGDRVTGLFALTDALLLRLGGSLTHYLSTPQSTAENVFLVSGGTMLDLSDHWTVGVDGAFSPSSSLGTTQSAVIDAGAGMSTPVSVDVRTRTWSGGLGAMVEYDTAGDSKAETVGDLSLFANSYNITNTIQGARGLGGAPISPSALICGANGCSGPLRNSLAKSNASLWQMRAALGLTETLSQDTDLDLVANYYLYTEDPTQVGLYSVGTFARTAVGEGIPTLPLRFSVRPSVLHRFGQLGVGAAFQYGRFVDDTGHNEIGSLRVEYKFVKTFKAWLSGNLEHDVDSTGTPLNTGWAGVGARLRF